MRPGRSRLSSAIEWAFHSSRIASCSAGSAGRWSSSRMRSLATTTSRSAVDRCARVYAVGSGRDDEELTRDECRGRQMVPLLELPDPLPRITAVAALRDRPERVPRFHPVVPLRPTGTALTGEERPEKEHRQDEGSDADERRSSEHLFPCCQNTCSVSSRGIAPSLSKRR